MAQVTANGISLEYERFGAENREVVLLIQGLGAQLVHWPQSLCDQLVQRGFQVIRYDNRDIGLSQKFAAAGLPSIPRIMSLRMLGMKPDIPYTLLDMAEDAVGLLDALGIEGAHIVGASMGGMIAQLVAGHFPDRARSLTSIMSTTGNPGLPRSRPRAAMALMSPHADPDDLDAIARRSIRLMRAVGSPAYPTDDESIRQRATLVARRSYYPPGAARHFAASISAGDRRKLLNGLRLPTTVLHGEEDPLMPVACGMDTASNIPYAELRTIPGMGHDFPEALMPVFADAIEAAARRA